MVRDRIRTSRSLTVTSDNSAVLPVAAFCGPGAAAWGWLGASGRSMSSQSESRTDPRVGGENQQWSKNEEDALHPRRNVCVVTYASVWPL